MTTIDRTPEEQRVLDEIAAQTAAGGDPFGDEEELVREGSTPPADVPPAAETVDEEGDEGAPADGADGKEGEEGEDAASTEQQAAEKNDEIDPEELADIADPPQLTQPPRFQAEAPKEFKEQRSKLLGERATATAKLMNGEIDTEQYTAEEIRITEALDELTRQQVRAETLAEVNRQNDANYSQRALDQLIRRAKAEVDYKATPAAAQQFDRSLQVLLADPEYAGKDIAEVYDDAHKMVCAMRGVQQGKVSKPAAAPSRQPEGSPPVTLRNLPAAASTTPAGGVEEQLARLHGPEYEAAFAKLTPAQRARILDEE